MPLSTTFKNISIQTGLYATVRGAQRRMNPAQREAHNAAVRFYQGLLPPGALCFDVGANIGEYTEAMLKAGAKVVAFEPSPETVLELKARCPNHPNLTVIQAAVGEKGGMASLYASGDSEKSSLDKEWNRNALMSYAVPVVTLQDAIGTFGTPFYCKVDVEGWETQVLTGLGQGLPMLSFEFHLGEKDVARTKACLQRLAEFGPGTVNVTPAESFFFQMRQWMPLDEFMRWFPGDLHHMLGRKAYGDIFVRRDSAGLDQHLPQLLAADIPLR